MSKSNILIGAIAVVVVGLGGYHFYAQGQAEQRVQDLVYSTDLLEEIEYGDVSYNIFTGTTTIHDVLPDGDKEYDVIESIDIYKAEFQHGVDLHVSINNSRTDLVEQFRYKLDEKDFSEVTASMRPLAVGIRERLLDLELQFRFDPENEFVVLDLFGEDNVAGAFTSHLKLENVSRRLFGQIEDMVSTLFTGVENIEELDLSSALTILEQASKAQIAELEVEIDPTPTINIDLKHDAIAKGLGLDEAALAEHQESIYEEGVAELGRELEKKGVSPRKVSKWMDQIGPDTRKLRITTDIRRPVRLSKLIPPPGIAEIIKLFDVDLDFER